MLISLRAWRPDGWTATSIEHFELNTRRVYGISHNSAEGRDLPNEMPLRGPAHGRVARHMRNTFA
jgi:hypothetical protein